MSICLALIGIHLTTDSLQRAIHLIEGRTGLAVSSLLRADVSHIVERLSYGNIDAWVHELEISPEDSPAWQRLLGALTIGETYFMRDPQHFKLLRERLLPPLVLKRRQAGQFELNVLSVGCSTGEEPYSIAIALNEFLPDIDRWKINLYGMDINSASLQQAQRATYRMWSFRHVNETFLKRYFVPVDDMYHLRDEIVRRVTFIRGNLINPPNLPNFDIILCRNILLYFTARHVQMAEDNLYRLLRPGGWLILGSAEALRTRRERWQIDALPHTPFYQKTRKRPTQPLVRLLNEVRLPANPDVVIEPVDVTDAEGAILGGDNDHAERLLGQILMETPNNPRANTLLAFIFASRKAYPEASNHLEIALRYDPTHSDAYYLRALMLNEQDEPLLAQKELQAALYYHRDHMLSLLMMGTIHLSNGDIPKAHKLWQRARSIAEKMPQDRPISTLTELTASQVMNMVTTQLES